MNARSTLALALFLAIGMTSMAMAQRPRREVQWVNPDIPTMPGLVHKVLDSKSLGHPVGYVIWTPPEMDISGQTRYPVVYFLHGAGGSEKSDAAGFASQVAGAIRSGKFPAAICVFPNGGMSGYRGDAEAMIIDELIPLVDKDYPTQVQPSGRVICGFSMGGAGSVHLSLNHPELFCGAGSWGGALSFRGSGEDSPLLAVAKQNADKLKANHYALLTINGDQDRPDAFKPLQAVLDERMIPHRVVVLEDTNHNLGKYHQETSSTMLEFLASQLNITNP
ncbi:Endo-1,4-beta-xylanase/feruloyl esterase precursor [Bremerella volcania]|uniref:Endo-1,4-beta-xylanase/feruloyl esterase n=1 Tax=Bremerella volcania TaxID=2527984 RepID=A0A518C9W8_9BACT|nr:alpha/beta hydrolase-fold protein [Bremerella volcania]QDU76026.1 Endo-1,4-beta-xylanase/feruloyl esterase precursor [Bremerella volcania]